MLNSKQRWDDLEKQTGISNSSTLILTEGGGSYILLKYKIHSEQGDIINSGENIDTKAINFYEEKFREEQQENDYSMIDYIPKLI